MAKVLKHVHKLKRVTHSNGEQIYFCVLDECEYKINVKLALGKPCLCWRCAKRFNLNEYALRLAKPHCVACTKSDKLTLDEVLSSVNPNSISSTIADDSDLLSRVRKTISHSVGVEPTIDIEATEDDLM